MPKVEAETIRNLNLLEHIKKTTPVKEHRFNGYLHLNPCPLCGGHDCFSVKNNRFKCFQCLSKGSIIDFEADFHGVSVALAINNLVEEYHLEPDPDKPEESPVMKILRKSKPLDEVEVFSWLGNVRNFGQFTDLALEEIKNAGCFRQGKYGEQPVLICPLFRVNQINLCEIGPQEVYSVQLLSLSGENLPGIKSSKIFPKGCKGKGVIPFINNDDNTVYIVESLPNALALKVAGLSSVCIFTTSNLNMIPQIQKALPEKEIVLWLDRGVEEMAVQACHDCKIDGIWFDLESQDKFDINDLLTKSDNNFEQEVDAMTTDCLGPEPYWWSTRSMIESARPKDTRPVITIEGGQLHNMTDKAEQILMDSDVNIYQRSGNLVHIASHGMELRPVQNAHLVELFTRLISWQKFNPKAEAMKPSDCPKSVVDSYMARPSWEIRPLQGIITAPIIRKDGSIFKKPGYDEHTGLFFYQEGEISWNIPENPTREQAMDALLAFEPILRDFPFASDIDMCVFLAAIFTAIIRPILRTAPLFAFSAPKMGSGKSLQANIVSLISIGREMLSISQTKDTDEEKKRLLGVLLAASPVVCFDDCSEPIESAPLCSILTMATWGERILGQNYAPQVSTTSTTWLATGNNISFVGDISTRALVCNLDPQCERPEEREFDINLYEYIPAHRKELIEAALTILRAYIIHGRPKAFKPFGRFEEWSDLIRGALVWIGLEDPCSSRRGIEETDPRRDQLINLLTSWYSCFGDSAKSLKEAEEFSTMEEGEPAKSLRIAMEAIDSKRNLRVIGAFIGKHKNRIEKALFFAPSGKSRFGKTWKVMEK